MDATRGVTRSAGLRYTDRQGRWVVLATVLGSGMAALDATVVSIALPAIGKEFHAGLTGLQWVVTGYALTLSGLLLVGGALGDRFGRRRVYLVGMVWFALASLLAGLAPDENLLVAARALQGVGGALLTPGSLAILQASFRVEDRGRAIGAWSGFGGLATAVGPFIGGWLISAVSWRAVFFLNLPLALLVMVICVRHVPESRDETLRGRVDLPGAVLCVLGLTGVSYGLINSSADGWLAAPVLLPLLVGLIALAAFIVVEARTAEPMLSLRLFLDRQFSAANAVTFVVYAALGGALFLLPVTLQQVAGYSPLASGASLLPITAVMLLLSPRSGMLASRIGPRLQMTVGPLLAGAGLALMTLLTASGDYVTEVLPGVLVLGLGLATTVAPLTATVLAAAPVEHAGAASATNNFVARCAGLMAVAVLPSAAGITTASYQRPASLLDGFRTAMLIAGLLCAAGGLLAVATIRNRRAVPEEPAREPAAPRRHCALEGPPLCEPTRQPAGVAAGG